MANLKNTFEEFLQETRVLIGNSVALTDIRTAWRALVTHRNVWPKVRRCCRRRGLESRHCGVVSVGSGARRTSQYVCAPRSSST